MKSKPQYYQALHNPSPAAHQYSESLSKSSKNGGIKLVRDKLKNRRPSSGAHSKKNSVTGMSIELQKSRMGIGSPIISKLEKDSTRKNSTGTTPVNKSGKGIKMKKSSIKTASSKGKYSSIIGSRSRMQSSQVSQQSTNTRKKLAKDRIIEYVAQYIRTKHYSSELEAANDEGYEDMINNLKEFLQYLEDKNIINPKQLEDEKEINNLISDILKLDLTKFKGSNDPGSTTASKKRSGSQGHAKEETDLKQNHFHKRSGSERVSAKNSRLKDVRHSDTPNADTLLQKRIKTASGENKRTTTIEHAQSQHSNRRMNPSLEERKSTSSSINSNAIPTSKHRRAVPSLEKKSSTKSSVKEGSVKINNSSRSSQKHHNSQASNERVQMVENEKSTKESTNIVSTVDMTNNSSIQLNEAIVTEREKLIHFIKIYAKRHDAIPPTTLDFYKFVKLIGKGAFGKVTLGMHKLTGKHVAIKTFEKSYMKDDFSRKKVFQEVYILKKIHHSNIIRLLEVFESSKHFFIVMEYAGAGDLLHYVKKKRRLQETEARFIFKQVLYGLGHCHCRSVLHRDIKLDNVLLDNEKGIKLCDFGVSKIIKKHQFIREQCGTPAYIAPEIIADEGYEGFFADLWSLGVVLYAML